MEETEMMDLVRLPRAPTNLINFALFFEGFDFTEAKDFMAH